VGGNKKEKEKSKLRQEMQRKQKHRNAPYDPDPWIFDNAKLSRPTP
jgi:hypothetical protein